MASHHKVIALISGGKDSFLSILQCQRQGHEVIALANLYPQATEDDLAGDLNSHMYQTAGHALIPFYEEALNIPLYRQEIRGKARQFGKEYDHALVDGIGHDETEDLTTLLRDILKKHPDATAVCSGAVLSTYQRTRVESVCLRLNMKPLSFLWQMSFLPGLSDTDSIFSRSCAFLDYVAEIGLDARIVKVASGGLDESFLWESLLNPRVRHKLKTVMKKFGGSVIGEGGEFETLILSGPKTLFKGDIIVPDSAIRTRTGEGGEAWLEISDTSGICVKLSGDESTWYEQLSQGVTQAQASNNGVLGEEVNPLAWSPVTDTSTKGNLLWISNLHGGSHTNSCAQQMQRIVDQLRNILRSEKLTTGSLVFTMIILRRMEDFEAINLIYGNLFDSPLPAARATIAAGNRMPRDVDILLSCVVFRGDLNFKQGLHVQSISHWAPANIGPYSQAVSVPIGNATDSPRQVYIAGQIPLVPQTMQPLLPHGETIQEAFREQAVMAFRHATRIGIEMKVNWWSHAMAYVCTDEYMDAAERAVIAYDIWKGVHETLTEDATDDEGPDVWDLKYGGQGSHIVAEDDRRLPSPNYSREIPEFLAVEVYQLPRKQTIEWQTHAITGDFVGSIDGLENFTRFLSPRRTIDMSSIGNVVVVPCHRVWRPVEGKLVELE